MTTPAPSSTPTVCPLCRSAIPADAPSGACPRCLLAAGTPTGGSNADASALGAADVAARFPDYEILGFLGRGGMGVVWKARHIGLDRPVALKVLPATVATTPGFAERFQREARALARLSHPNIVAVHEYGERDGTFFLVMEFVEGVNLRAALREGRVGPREALRIVPQICDALQYAHDHGVVHRDIKPENVLVSPDGRVRVADFGLAKILGAEASSELTLTGQVMGTPVYMAPEQVERPASVDHRADIYSLGVVFYEMLTGELPLGRFDAPSKRTQLDVRLDEVVLRSLEKQPERRWQHASDVRAEVGAIEAAPTATSEATRAKDAGPAAESTPGPRTDRLAVVAFCALVAAVGFALLGAGFRVAIGVMAALCGTCLFLAVIGGIVASVRVARSKGTRDGLGYAVTATILGLVLPVGFVLMTSVETSRAGRSSNEAALREKMAAEAEGFRGAVRFYGPDGAELGGAFVTPDERAWLLSQWDTARRALGSEESVLTSGVYHPTDIATLEAMPRDERRAKGAKGELGLPLLDPARLGGPASELRLVSVRADEGDLTATGTVTNGRVVVRFPLTRIRTGPAADRMTSRLYFGIGPVVIE